jgi:pimeloyl-ACP methyl ester carboxylesterase
MTLQALRERWPVATTRVAGHDVGFVRTSGAGTPVLWLPGAQGNAEMFFKQFVAWGERRCLIALNYPALSEGAALADFVAAFAQAQRCPRYDLVGTSLGGYIAQWVAVRHAASVERLVIGNSFCDPTPAQTPDKLEALQGRSAEAVKDEMMGRIEAGPDSELKQVQLELVGRCQGAELLHARLLAVQRAAPVPSLGVPDERVLLVECDNDPLIPPPMRDALRAAHPQARHVTVPGGGHYPYLLRAEAYNEAVGAFLGLG